MRISKVTVSLPRGMTRKAAMAMGWHKAKRKGKGDFRGFKYSPKTGKATFV